MIYGHPTQVQGLASPNATFNNTQNLYVSLSDLSVDDALAAEGYSISVAFTHYVLATDDAVRAYREGPEKIVQGSRVVTACSH